LAKYQETRQKMQGKDPGVALELERDVIKELNIFPTASSWLHWRGFRRRRIRASAHSNGKETWCEKTLSIFSIWIFVRLFPSVFIHIKRDQEGCPISCKAAVGPNDIQQAACFMKNMYQRWFNLKPTLDLERHKFLEIKLEDLITYQQELLEEVTLLCGLENHDKNLPEFSLEKANYWQKTLTIEDIDKINQVLGAEIEQMGYEV
jgi:hypothetical protein